MPRGALQVITLILALPCCSSDVEPTRDANVGDTNVGDTNLDDANVSDANIGDANVGDANVGDAAPDGPSTSDSAKAVKVPADRLDLTNWKLTLPVGTSGTPDEIEQPTLSSYTNPPYFQLTPNKDGVQFRAHCGGVTTSGSGYPRSELREMTGSGGTKASWSTSSGTHTMFIKQAITHLPAVKPHVVAGQIHDSSDDVIVIRLEGSKLFIDLNGKDGPTLDSSYTLGQVFSVRFVASGGSIKVYYNGAASPAIDYTKAASGCYFKAGCYTQSNTSKGDAASAYGEVVIYELTVSHS